MFPIEAEYTPTDDQSKAVDELVSGLRKNKKNQVLLGVTGSGKTFTMANVIHKTKYPALIISHNKTLAGQLYQEMKSFFPSNAVSYFVSYYDYYQPEAYIPSSDTYVEKEASINVLIDKLRLNATTNLLTRDDVIVVASVSCIYNIGSPIEYKSNMLTLTVGEHILISQITSRLITLQYERSEFDFKPSTYRMRGTHIDIYPAYADEGTRVMIKEGIVYQLDVFDPITGMTIRQLDQTVIFASKHFMINRDIFSHAKRQILKDLSQESKLLKKEGKSFEAERLIRKVTYDLEMIQEMGYVNGIENYSRYFDGRNKGDAPFSLLDYFNHRFGKKWLVFTDESHMTIPQIRGMQHGDLSRKNTLIEYGFRLKSARDNRPLTFGEFYDRTHHIIYVSATPDSWEVSQSDGISAQQLVRPTGIVDPPVKIKIVTNEITDLLSEIRKRSKKKERVLITTLTKRTAEDLTEHFKDNNIRAEYLHSDIKTLLRSELLTSLREGEFDVLIGVNLLREGLDIPEVSLVVILDADKEGFLRSKTALIQTMGRASRHIRGEVILYTHTVTRSIQEALDEVSRRRSYQLAYNKKHGITPRSIAKSLQAPIAENSHSKEITNTSGIDLALLANIDYESMTFHDKRKLISKLKKQMQIFVQDLNFESAIILRDKILNLENTKQ